MTEQINIGDKKSREEKKFKDAVSYLDTHKEVIVPAKEIPPVIEAKFRDCWIGNEYLWFIDGEGNLMKVVIDYDKIESITPSKKWTENRELFKEALESHGFKVGYLGDSATDSKLRGLHKAWSDFSSKNQK